MSCCCCRPGCCVKIIDTSPPTPEPPTPVPPPELPKDDVWVGTYVGVKDIFGGYIGITFDDLNNRDIGIYQFADQSDAYGGDNTHEYYLMSTPLTNTDKVRELTYTPHSDGIGGILDTDFAKNGKPLTENELKDGVKLRFVAVNDSTIEKVYKRDLADNDDEVGTYHQYNIWGISYIINELDLNYGSIKLDGVAITSEQDITALGKPELYVKQGDVPSLRTTKPVVLTMQISDPQPQSHFYQVGLGGIREFPMLDVEIDIILIPQENN